jgi:hypothetical protein
MKPRIRIEVEGVSMPLAEFAKAHGLNPRTVRSRLRRKPGRELSGLTSPPDERFKRRGNW